MRRFALFALSIVLPAACAGPSQTSHSVQPADPPAYRWRGLGLDVARHFYGPPALRRVIDLAAHYRLNIVHLHLTDNEAWRLPSRRFSRLPSSQHYTETQLRELVGYARMRGVTLVPEIDMPAHSGAAIRSYPALACGKPDTLCPDRALAFAKAVIAETATLFDSSYIHTGGDEVDGWTPQQRTHFEYSLDAAIARAHRTMVVWDDESDAAPPDVIVQVWHLGDAASKAQRLGHPVVISQDGPLYFDAVQGAADQEPAGTRYMTTLEEVLAFSAPPRAFGLEAMLWSEHVKNEDDMWYLLLPRAIAFAAVLKGSQKPQWQAFLGRMLPNELKWLLVHRYPFRVPNTMIALEDFSARYVGVPGNQDAAVATVQRSRVTLVLEALVPHATIRYRVAPQMRWRAYTGPISLRATGGTQVQAQTVSPDGRAGAIATLYVKPAVHPEGSDSFDDIVSP